MRILFIGGTGNISTECAALLHERGHEILVVSRGQSVVPAEYQVLKVDRKDPAAMREMLGKVSVDVVLNFLGYEVPELEIDHAVFAGRVRQYVFISSATVYAKPPPQLPITEDMPLGNAYWEYARKKLACEEWLRERWAEERFPVTIVRPSHTYSRRWIPNAVSSSSYAFADRLERGLPVFVMDEGESPWTLTATADFAVGLAGLVGRDAALGEAYHITSDEVLTWNAIYAEIAKALGVAEPRILKIPTDFICQVAPPMTGPLKGDKATAGVFDNTKIKRMVPGFECRKRFATGIRESVEWLRAHPEQRQITPQSSQVFEEVVGAWAGKEELRRKN